MGDYVLQIRYGETEPPLRIPLDGVSPEDAEVRRQELVTEIDHALEIRAPEIYSDATPEQPSAGVAIDPARVTSVELVDAD